MNERIKSSVARLSAISLVACAVIAARGFGARASAGIILGGAWNLASLWCLTRLLQAWMGPKPSQRRAIIWLLVKFPLLYAAIFLVFQAKVVPFQAFTIGFSVVLAVATAAFLMGVRQTMAPVSPDVS